MNKPITTKEMEDWIKTEWTARQREVWESYVDHQNVQAAADIREAYKNGYFAGAAAEREACAMEALYEAARWGYNAEVREVCERIAADIRSRGKK